MTETESAKVAVQRFYDAEAAYMESGARDFSAVAGTLNQDIVLFEPSSLPYGGEYHGHDGFELWMRAFADVWSSLEVRDSETFAIDNTVFSRSHVYAKACVTGASVDWPLLQYFRIRDGRISELRPFHWDTAAMLPALKK